MQTLPEKWVFLLPGGTCKGTAQNPPKAQITPDLVTNRPRVIKMTNNKDSCLSKSGKTEPVLIWSTYRSQCKCIKSFRLEVYQNQCRWQLKGKLQYVIGIVLTKGGQAEEQRQIRNLSIIGRRPVTILGLLLISRPVVSDPLRPHGLQHARPPCPPPSPRVCPSSCPLYQWCQPAISSSDTFFSCPQSFPASEIAACEMWGSFLIGCVTQKSLHGVLNLFGNKGITDAIHIKSY